MATPLSFKYRKFVDEYVKNGGNAGKAWLAVHPRKVYPQRNTPYHCGWLVIHKPQVQKYLQQKLRRMIKRGMITEEAILTKYEDAYLIAKSQAKPSDMVNAAREQAKLVGLLKDRTEVGPPGSFDHLESTSAVLEHLAEQVGSEIAQKVGQALGVLPATNEQPNPEEKPAELVTERETIQQAIDLLDADTPTDSVN